jgi:FkbM family methyltransferase
VIRHLLQRAERVVDAGANMGVYTLFLARYAPRDCEVVSIEPIPPTFDLLKSNVTSLGLRNVRLINLALSDTSREVLMEIPADEHGLARIRFMEKASQRGWSTYTVPARKLDDILPADGQNVSLLKIDVEMHELECLRGARETIRSQRPAIFIEIQPDLRNKESQRDAIVRFLKEEAYLPYWYDHAMLRLWNGQSNVLDYFFLTAAHLEALRSAGVPLEERVCVED